MLDEAGNLLPVVKEIVALIKEHNAVLATSHLSPKEIIALAKYCEQEKTKCVVTHLGWTPEYNFELGQEAIAHKAIVELTAVTFGGFAHKMKLDDCINFIHSWGRENIVLSTDAGAIRFVQPCEYLRSFGEYLISGGIPEDDVRYMMTDQPLKLIAE